MKKKATPNAVAEENDMALRWLLTHHHGHDHDLIISLFAFGGGAKGRSEERVY